MAQELHVAAKEVLPLEAQQAAAALEVSPATIKRSLEAKMECSVALEPAAVQEAIDYMAELGYINRFDAGEILELSFLEDD